MSFCSDCGFKIEGEFKFCPNCGTKINSLSHSSEKHENTEKIIFCRNCGEENSIESPNCFSCGVPLKAVKQKKKVTSDIDIKIVNQKKSTDKKYSASDKLNSYEKTLNNKTILYVSSVVVIIFIAALLITEVFDSGVQNNFTHINDESSTSKVSLENLNEIAELENKVIANPDDLESTLHLAHLLQDSRLYEKAIINYKKYLEKNPANADARVDMGICYYNFGDNATAINEMETALRFQPKHQIAHLNLGIVNLTSQNIDMSKEWFRKAVELDPDSEAGRRAKELLNTH